jgi:hypothetical protein
MPPDLAGVNNAGAASVATALRENKTLEHLDVSGRNAIDAIGVEQVMTTNEPSLMAFPDDH